jgi:glycosyltransferase involved in cell wall biosynthesis
VRFVFVSETPERVRGGIERHAKSLVDELVRRGHSARLVRPEEFVRSDAHGADWLVFDGVRRSAILRHARRSRTRPRLALFPHGSFMETARREELVRGGVWTPPTDFRWRALFDRTLGRWVYRRFDRWFVLADAEGHEVGRLFGIPPDRVTVLGLFVSREFLGAVARSGPVAPSPAPYLVSVARVERRKNFGRLLEAIADQPYRFVLAGQDRGGLAELRATARRFPTAHWEYRGTVTEEEKVDLLRGAEAVVVPSVLEGVPTIALEALALGRRVLLAGEAYGPDGPGVTRCGSRAAEIRAGLETLRRTPDPSPRPPPTVEAAVDQLLEALSSPRGAQ